MEQDCLMYIPISETILSLLINSAVLSDVGEHLLLAHIENGHQSLSVFNDYWGSEGLQVTSLIWNCFCILMNWRW